MPRAGGCTIRSPASTHRCARGGRLILRRGPAAEAIDRLVAETGAAAVYWNRRYEPWATARDAGIKASLRRRGIEARSFNAGLLREPWEIRTGAGGPYKVFTPFWKALRASVGTGTPAPAPPRIPAPRRQPASERLAGWRLTPSRPDWALGLRAAWVPGEDGAARRLARFLDCGVQCYPHWRDLADAGVRLGRDYPAPILDHAVARERALAAHRTLGKG